MTIEDKLRKLVSEGVPEVEDPHDQFEEGYVMGYTALLKKLSLILLQHDKDEEEE